ncbi:cell wall hydrolase [Acinetobacter guerrae]|uniref:cell wall hydrolase n=1 Tax=Acinetobacter guerrae TaxID=1843371 RepID=UPI00125EB7CA|nr:cell wall hydrolase [Acinetobacter guerrae]
MAQEGVIRNFMVALGFKTDNSGLGQMQNAMKGVELKAVALKGALMALATGAVIAVRQTASELDKLYFSSQRIGASATNITAFGNAISQMGGNAETALGTLESLAEKMRNSPGYEGMINSLGVNTKQANGEMRDRVDVMKDLSGVLAQMPAYQANAYASSLGIDQNTLLAMRDGKFLSNMEKYQKIQEQLGMNDDLTKSGNEFMTEYRDLTMMTKTGFQVIVMQAGKALIPILRLLNQLIQSGISAFSQLNPEIKNMLGIALRFAMATLVFGGFIKTFGLLLKFIPMIKGLIGLVRLLNLSLLASPIGFIIALAAALALLYDDYQTWKEGGKSLIDWSNWTEGIESAFDVLKSIYQNVVAFKDNVTEALSELDPSVQNTIKTFAKFGAIGLILSRFVLGFKILGIAKKAINGLGGSIKWLFKLFSFSPIGRAIALIGLLITAIGWLIKDFNKWKSGADSFLPWAKWSKSIDRIMDKIRSFLDLLGNVKDKVINFVQKIISDPVGAIKDVVEVAKDGLESLNTTEPSEPVKKVNEVSKNIVDGANNIANKTLEIGITTIKGLIGSTKETLGLGDNQSKADATKLADGVKAITQKGVEAVVNVGKSVDQTVKTSFSTNKVGKELKLSEQDIVDIMKVASTEVVGSLKGKNFENQAAGVVDTILNRAASEKFGDGVRGVVNQPYAFSDINSNQKTAYGSVQKVPMSRVSKRMEKFVREYLEKRANGQASSVGENISYANPNYLGKASASTKKWVAEVEAQAKESGQIFGAGKAIHVHGTPSADKAKIPKPYYISTPTRSNTSNALNNLPKDSVSLANFAQNAYVPTGNPNKEQVNQTNSNTKSSQVTIHQEYKTEMTINGARDPQASAQAVKRSQENANVFMARNAVGAIA